MKRLFSVIIALTAFVITGSVSALAKKEVKPVYASDLVFGSYEIEAAVSNSEFNAEKCILNVSGDIMTARMTLAGNEVTALYFGSAEDARRAEESGSLSGAVYPDKDENGRNVYVFRVDALDKKISCAAYNELKGGWTDRDIMLKSKSLPDRAFKLTRTQNTAAVVIPIIIVIAAAGGTFALISINKKNDRNDRGGEE